MSAGGSVSDAEHKVFVHTALDSLQNALSEMGKKLDTDDPSEVYLMMPSLQAIALGMQTLHGYIFDEMTGPDDQIGYSAWLNAQGMTVQELEDIGGIERLMQDAASQLGYAYDPDIEDETSKLATVVNFD